MATEPITTQGTSEKKNDALKTTAAVGAAAAVGAVAGACITSAQADVEPDPKPVEVDTSIQNGGSQERPEYTGPSYQHDPESENNGGTHQSDTHNTNTHGGNSNTSNTNENGGNQSPDNDNNGGDTPQKPTAEEEAAMKEIENSLIDENDLDKPDQFTVEGFKTIIDEDGELIEVAEVSINGNTVLLRDTDGDGIYDSYTQFDSEDYSEIFNSLTLTKDTLLEKMNLTGYIAPEENGGVHDVLPPSISEDIAIIDASASDTENIVNSVFNEELIAGVNLEGEEPVDEEEILALINEYDDDEDVDYDDTVNEEELLAMLDDDTDEEEESDDDDDDDDDNDVDDDDMDLDELDA